MPVMINQPFSIPIKGVLEVVIWKKLVMIEAGSVRNATTAITRIVAVSRAFKSELLVSRSPENRSRLRWVIKSKGLCGSLSRA